MFKVITKIADTPSLTKVSSKENLDVNKEANKKIVFDEYKCKLTMAYLSLFPFSCRLLLCGTM